MSERKNKTLIQISLGVSIVLHLLIFIAIIPELTHPPDMGDISRVKPLVVYLEKEAPTPAPPRVNATEHSPLRAWPPGARSPAIPDTEADVHRRESDTVRRFDPHAAIPTEPTETRQMAPKELAAPETDQERTAIPDIIGTSKRDLHGFAHDFIQQEGREEALRKRRQNELWHQAPSEMRAPPPPITDKSSEPDEQRSAVADALKVARKASQEYVIALPLSKKCVFGIKRFDREQAERDARREPRAPDAERDARIEKGAYIPGLHCRF